MADISVIPLVRMFARKPKEGDEGPTPRETVLERAPKIVEVIKASGAPWVGILVPRDYDHANAYGGLVELFDGDDFVKIITAPGHHSCGALNHGVECLEKMGATHALILSGKAAHFLTPDVYQEVVRLHDSECADVVGAATGNLADVVREGIPQNTFCSWEIEYLQAVGGFVNELGVEEIDPLVEMCLTSTLPFIGIIDVEGDLDIRADAEAQRRHASVLGDKRERQNGVLKQYGFDRTLFRNYIIKS